MICLLGIIAVIIGVILDQVTKYFASSYIKDNPIIIVEDVLELEEGYLSFNDTKFENNVLGLGRR